MAARIPLVGLGTAPNFTGITQLKTGDTIAGVINHADYGVDTVIVSNADSDVVVINLAEDTVLGNIGDGPEALAISALKTELEVPVLLIDTERTTSFTAVFNTLHLADVRAGTCLVAPPVSPTAKSYFMVCDSRASSATNAITVDFVSASQKFYGADSNSVINTNGRCVTYRYINGTIGWIVQ